MADKAAVVVSLAGINFVGDFTDVVTAETLHIFILADALGNPRGLLVQGTLNTTRVFTF